MYLFGVSPAEEKYGQPAVQCAAFPMRAHEFVLLRRSMHQGRQHDTTVLIIDGPRVAVIRKPSYPPGVYRPPSGGVYLNETLEEGTLREAYEETGLKIQLTHYLLRVFVNFLQGDATIHWTSHVFAACCVGGNLSPVDTREIAEARWASLHELDTNLKDGLLAAGSSGLAYRAQLQCWALIQLWKAKGNSNVRRVQEDFMD